MKFNKTDTICVPFFPQLDTYYWMYKELDKMKPPKGTKMIKIKHEICISLKKGGLNYKKSEIKYSK